MQKSGQQADPEVTRQDQQNINAFNRLNQRFHELEDELKAKKDELQNLEDASSDLMMCDDDDIVKYQMGEAFVDVKASVAQELVDKSKERVQGQVDTLVDSIASAKSKMEELKKTLYGKFGNAINLEEES
eukprot:tig00021357_g20735.t1